MQHQLFNLGASCRSRALIAQRKRLCCSWTGAPGIHNAQLPRLQEFILPAGTRRRAGSHLPHRGPPAERAVVALGSQEGGARAPRHYLNRLSDLMFVLSRVLNRMDGGDDVC